MPATKRFSPATRAFDERKIQRQQEDFSAGLFSDLPGTNVPRDGVHQLENFVNHGNRLTGRNGNQLWSDTALSGSGTTRNWYYHEVQDKLVLHRGTSIWTSPLNTISWTEAVGINGTIGNSYTEFEELDDSVIAFNKDGIFEIDLTADPVVYYKINSSRPATAITDSGTSALEYGRRYVYSGLKLAGSGSRDRTSAAIKHETGTTAPGSTGEDWGAVWSSDAFDGTNDHSIGTLTKESDWGHLTHYGVYATNNLGQDGYDVDGAQYQSEQYTWLGDIPIARCVSGIVSASTLTCTVGTLSDIDVGCTVKRSSDNNTYKISAVATGGASATLTDTDDSAYSGGDVGAAIGWGIGGMANGDVLVVSQSGTTVTKASGNDFVAGDVGKPIFMAGDIVTWIQTVTDTEHVVVTDSATRSTRAAAMDPVSRTFNDKVSELTLEARITAYSCFNRLYQPLPSCNRGCIAPSLFCTATADENTMYYSDIFEDRRYLIGSHYLARQSTQVKGAIQALVVIPDMVSIFCTSSTNTYYTNSLGVYDIPGTVQSVSILASVREADKHIGTKAHAGIVEIASGKLRVITSEPAIRDFDGEYYGENLAEDRIMDDLKQCDPEKIVASYDPYNGYMFWAYQG